MVTHALLSSTRSYVRSSIVDDVWLRTLSIVDRQHLFAGLVDCQHSLAGLLGASILSLVLLPTYLRLSLVFPYASILLLGFSSAFSLVSR